MVQSAQNRRRDHPTVFGEAMTGGHGLLPFGQGIGNSGPQTGMWTAPIVVGDPFAKNRSEMSLVDGNQPVQTLLTHRTDQSFAKRVGLRRPRRSLEDLPAHRRNRHVDRCRKDAIPIVEDEPVRRLRSDDCAKLLNRPLRGGMLSHIPVQDATRTDFEDNEHIKDAKADRHGREEVTGHHGVRMIPHKRRPPLGLSPAPPGPLSAEIASDRAR
jgi:hypothetical protein